jgi:hypothetical protein
MKNKKIFFLMILLVSLGMRLILADTNYQANDNHIDYINWIIDKHEIPKKSDCWICYQPKFFYVISAKIITYLDIHKIDNRRSAIQFLDAILGFFILLVFWKFINKQQLGDTAKLLFFALFCFNPCLTGINVQATNDSLVIFGGVLAIYFCDLFFSNKTIANFIFLLASLLLCALAKTTGILLFGAILVFFIIKIFSLKGFHKKKRLLIFLTITLISFFYIVIVQGGYYAYYKNYNSLPTSAWGNAPPPFLFKETVPKDTFHDRPGITSISKGFFTFRYFDMVRQPYINNEVDNFPLHRTSLWSQLYGRTVFMHFDQWPPAWQAQTAIVVFIGRVLIILGIVPLLLFLSGYCLGVMLFFKNSLQKGRVYLATNNNYLHIGVTTTFLAASIKYSYDLRDYSTMKSIYLFPGLISYIKLMIDGYASIKFKLLTKSINIVLVIMIIYSIADIGYLIYQLQGSTPHPISLSDLCKDKEEASIPYYCRDYLKIAH